MVHALVKVYLITDHQPLIYLQTQATLSRRVARWVEYMQRFDFELTYSPGVGNVADPLSRWSLVVQAAAARLAVTTRRQAAGSTPQGHGARVRGGASGPAAPSNTSGGKRVRVRARGRMGGSARHPSGGMGHQTQPAPAAPAEEQLRPFVQPEPDGLLLTRLSRTC